MESGEVTMLAGHPFVGKTMLVSSLLKTMESGSDFLGRGTQRATAVVVTEEHEATLRPRAELLRLLELRSDFVGRSSGVFRVEWPALIEQATAHALRQAHKLLVVDTFTGLAGLSPEEENDAGAITARLRPLQAAAGEGLAVLFLHHLNKNGQPRGSSAFRGVTETAIQLQRAKGRQAYRDAIRTTDDERAVGCAAILFPGAASEEFGEGLEAIAARPGTEIPARFESLSPAV